MGAYLKNYKPFFVLKAAGLILSILLAETFAQQNQHRIWYDSPAERWEECVPLGNGRLGAMPDGGVLQENITLNDITLWSGGVQDADIPDAHQYLPQIQQLLLDGKNIEAQEIMNQHFACKGPGSGFGNGADVPYGSYQVLGNLHIQYDYSIDSSEVKPKNYCRQLSLDSAIAFTKFTLNDVTYFREYFTSFDDDVIIIKLSADELKKINFTVSLTRPERFTLKSVGNELQMSGQLNNGTDGKGMKYITRVSVKPTGGKITTENNSLRVKDADAAVIYISAGTDFIDPDFITTTKNILQDVFKKPYDSEKENHKKNFRSLFQRASISLGGNNKDNLPTDKRLESYVTDNTDNGLPVLYFQYGRYLLISSTRPGILPPNLQGLWANTISSPWNGDYHLNINIQMNHFPLDVTNLGIFNEPFFNLVRKLVKSGEKTARAYYNAEGWVAHVITNVWGYTSPGEHYSWGSFNTGSAWLCQMLWSHYEFTRDTSYLRDLYPVLKGSAEFYMSTMVKEPSHGWLITAPSNSPENGFILPDGNIAHVCYGPTIDNQIIRYLFTSVIEVCSTLKTDDEFKHRVENAKSLIPPNRIGEDGRLMEWLREYKELDPHHRHVSHLWGLHPGNEISMNTPALIDAAKATLEARGDDGTGWSLAWKINFWARLHDGNRALKLFRQLLKPVDTKVNEGEAGGTYKNLFCAHPPLQIDGNLGGTAGIAEMILQSQNDYIELLPALPDEWKEGSFSGLCVRGGAEISASWRNKKIENVLLKANTSNSFKIMVPEYVQRIEQKQNDILSEILPDNGFINLDMKKDETTEICFK